MTTTPGWEPRLDPARRETSRQTPRGGAEGWPAGDPRRRAGREGAPAGRPPGPSFTPSGRGPAGSVNGPPRPRPRGNGRGPGGLDGLEGLRANPLLRWVGAWSVRVAVLVLAAFVLLGVIFTLVAGKEPGFLIGLFITIGGAVAALGVRRGGVYLFFPLPALAAFVAAVLAGKIHDSQLTASTAGTAVGFLQWIAGVFYPMVAATIVVLLIGGARWLLSRQLVSGQFGMFADRAAPGARPGLGDRRPAADLWSDPDLTAGRLPGTAPDRPARDRPAQDPTGRGRPRPDRAPWLGQNGARSARTARERPDRDPWGDPRLAADRGQPGTNQPGTNQPGTASRPDARGARPAVSGSPGSPDGQGGSAQPRPARPQPRDPRDPRDPRNPRPRRPPPRQPGDPWGDR